MKRVVCLLLCAVLLMGLLPAAALADGELRMYFEICEEDGVVRDATRWPVVGSIYGDSIFFRAYTAETGGEAITGDQLRLYENNEDVTDSMLTWIPSENNGYYKWDSHAAKTVAPVFLATIGEQKYEGSAQVHEAEVGWFSSRDKSISTALTYGFATDANVYYDGKKDVTVYLTADFSFVTNISESDIETTEGIEFELEDRGNNEGTDLGKRLKVTCKAPWSGDLWLRVRVEERYILNENPQSIYYTVTFSKDGKKTGEEGQSRPGEPTAIEVEITDENGNVKKETCWFGVGEYANDKYDILSGSSMGSPSYDTNFAILAVGLWWKDERSDGTWDLAMLSKEEAKQVMQQAKFHLNFYPQSGQAADDPPKVVTLDEIIENYNEHDYSSLIKKAKAAKAVEMPAAACYPLEAKHEGTWRVEAVCEMKGTGKTCTAYGNLERRVINVVELNDCKDVQAINDELKKAMKDLPETSKRRETNICVRLNEEEYTGQIDVPKIPKGYKEVSVEFVGGLWNRETETPVVELHGGICSDDAPIAVQRISFVGAGKQKPEDINSEYLEYWPKDGEHNGAENSALYGLAAATAAHCSFTGYYYAMKLTKEMRLCGKNNTYVENHIAWYLGEGNYNGGNPAANNCVFEGNDIAIWIKKFNLRPSFYAPSRCQFIDNKLDIQNDSGRAWFIPGNYFVHGLTGDGKDNLATAIDPATLVNCYPLCRREIINGKERDVFYYNYKQLGRNEIYQLANRLASTYQTPLAYLDGKTFEVVDEDSAQPLATFTFDSADSPAQRRAPAARRSIARFSAEEEKSFDATVRVRSSDERIDFTMNDPCRSVTVKLPCEFKYGTVTHTLNGKSEQLETVRFDGETVSFETSEGGDYTIEYRPSGGFIVAGYDDQERLVGVQFVSSKDDPVTITAPTIKYFAIDRSYRPLDEVVIPRR